MKLKALRRKVKKLLQGLGLLAFILLLIHLNRPHAESETSSQAAKTAPSTRDPETRLLEQSSRLQKDQIETSPSSIIFSIHHPNSFDDAKRILKRTFPKGKDVYCGCPYDFKERNSVALATCGLPKGSERRGRIEWEHVVPASTFGRKFAAWTQGDPLCQKARKTLKGRNCAREASSDFRRMEADLYNLLPAIGELNQARSDLAYGEVPGEPRSYGPCDFEIKAGRVEPPANVRGDVARIYVYMHTRYPSFGIVHPGNRSVLERWASEDPIDAGEAERLARIEAIQGNSFYIGPLESLRPSAGSPIQTVGDKL